MTVESNHDRDVWTRKDVDSLDRDYAKNRDFRASRLSRCQFLIWRDRKHVEINHDALSESPITYISNIQSQINYL